MNSRIAGTTRKVEHKKHMFDREGDCIWKGCEIKKIRCVAVGSPNRFGDIKDYSCLDLPPPFIHKKLREWLCGPCAMQIVYKRMEEKFSE